MTITATATKERPILFNGSMVRAILNGGKTQTRRIVKPQPGGNVEWTNCFKAKGAGRAGVWGWLDTAIPGDGPLPESMALRCPQGKPGERLWARETHAFVTCDKDAPGAFRGSDHGITSDFGEWFRVAYAADPGPITWDPPNFRPSIHMPRWACRLEMEVTSVRLERLQAITEADAQAEGATSRTVSRHYNQRGWSMDWSRVGTTRPNGAVIDEGDICLGTARMAFANLWNKVYGPEAWDSNPWVWVVEFKRVTAPSIGKPE